MHAETELSAHNFVDFRLQTSPTVSEVLRRYLCHPVPYGDADREEMSNNRRSPSLMLISDGAGHPC